MADINRKVENKIRLKSDWIKHQYDYLQKRAQVKLMEKVEKEDAPMVPSSTVGYK